MDTTMMPQNMGQAPFYMYASESKHQEQQMAALYRQSQGMPGTPAYSRPGSSQSQPPTLYSNGPTVMTPAASPPSHKPSIMLETDFAADSYFPSTPPLSTAGSSVGSPKSYDVLQTPMNPMFSGLDGFEDSKEGIEPVETSIVDWSSCGSPPMTPVYLQSQSGKALSLNINPSDLSAASCPSLSPSSTPYARSVAASEQDVDFCDPRNLLVTSASVTSNPTLAPESCVSSPASEANQTPSYTAPAQSSFEFTAIPDGLPSFDNLGELESEDDFVNSIVNLGDHAADLGRPRACTGSSVVSLGHGSFIGDDDLSFGEDAWQFCSLPSPPVAEDAHRNKRQKKSHKNEDSAPVVTMAAIAEASSGENHDSSNADDAPSPAESDSNGSTGSEAPAGQLPAPANRRGRKQSLTEDPSKTFVCDLCSRRFRRQEHLKRHYRSLHTQEKPFECNECGKKFSRSDNLAQHARTHAGGAIVMNLLEDGTAAYELSQAPGSEDYSTYGKVLFQIASEVPGSASEPSSEDDKDDSKKKRKRSD